MTFDLPPPATPQQVTVETAQAGASVGTVTFQQYTLHITGEKILDDAMLAAIVGGATNLSDAVRNIASAYYAAGYPAARVLYALSGNDLYVHADLGKATAVNAPEVLKPYLDGLENHEPLRDSDLEPRRTLAAMHAERAGLDASAAWVPDANNNLALDVSDKEGKDPLAITWEVGNPGNRFVGRHFADLGLRDGSTAGDELRANVRVGLKGLNDDKSSDHYYEGSLGWSRVTSFGLFGTGYRVVDYDFFVFNLPDDGNPATPPPPDELEFDGKIHVGEVFWFYPLYASFNSRLTTFLKVDHTRKTTDIALAQVQLQREIYNSAEAGMVYARSLSLLGKRTDLESSLIVRQGLNKSPLSISAADGDYLLFRPAVRVKHHFDADITTSIELSGQFSSDTVPEQSQWVIGGLNGLTAYLPGVAVGDSGYLARVQGEHLGDISGYEVTSRAFVEYAAAEFSNLGGGTPSAADVGVGVDVKLTPWFTTGLAYAYPFFDKDISDAVLDSAEANVYFKLACKF